MSMQDEGFKIFIGDLPPDITQEELRTVFGTYGEVGNIFMLGPQAGRSQRCALLVYARRESAEDAIRVLDGIYKIRADAESPIKVSWARDSRSGTSAPTERSRSQDGWKLFVGGLPADCTKEEVHTVFSTYGKVNTVHLMPPHAVNGRVAGFVFYETDTSGDDAIKVLDGIYKIRQDAESPITVKWAQDKSAGKGGGKGDWGACGGGAWSAHGGGAALNGSGGGRKSADGWKLFVGGLPKDCTEQELTTVFSTYGKLSKIMVMQPHAVNGRVAAFIFYEVESAAEDAIKVLDGVYRIRADAENPLQVRWAQDKNEKGGGKGGKGGFGGASASWGGSWGQGGGMGSGGGQAALGWQDSPGGWQGGGWQQQGGGWQGGGKGGCQSGGGGWGGKSGGGKGGNDWSSGGSSWSSGGGDWNRPPKGDGKGWQSGGKGGEVNPNKLFVGNLPPDITEETLGYVFNTYGQVTNIHIMAGKSTTGQACAFVEYASASDADTAVLTLHEKYEIKPGTGTILVKKSRSQNRSKPY